MKIPNPLEYIKRTWKDPKKRPLLLAGGGATAAAAYFTLRTPSGPDAAAEEAVAAEAASPSSSFNDGTYGAEVAGGGMHGTYVTGPSPVDYDSGFEEMDFSPLFDAMDEQAVQFEEAVATSIAVETKARQRQVKPIKKSVGQLNRQNKRQEQRLDRQKKSLRKQRKELAKVRQRIKAGPKKKPAGGKKKGGR